MKKQEDFDLFLSQLMETNATLNYFTDFEKVRRNVARISLKLNQLNYLLGKDDLQQAIHDLFEENPKVFDVLDILIAVRKHKKTKTFDRDGNIVLLENYFLSAEKVIEYILETGLADVFQNKDISNLVDYVFGIEVGLDSNARKNRSGDNMSVAVATIFDADEIPYESEVPNTRFSEILTLGVDVKRFDFVICTNIKTYLIETNFYNSSGSKPNEVARAYSVLAPKINQYPQFEFVWITDGQGWLSAKNKLQEAFNIIPSVYNLTTLANFISKIKSEGLKKTKMF